MDLLQKMQVVAKSHMSVIEDDAVDKVHNVFQRKRELARENYARSHGLNPDQLKNVAALKPLEKPVPSEEPEPEVKVAKKKATKKKAPAKPQVLVIKKAGQMTAVAKKAKAARDAEEQEREAEATRRRAAQEKRDADLAAKREEHAQAGQVKARLVKKVDIPKVEEVPVVVAPEPVAPVAEPVTAEAPVEATSAVEMFEVAEGETAPPVETSTAAADPAAAGGPAGPAHPLDLLGTKKHDGFKVGDIVRAAPKVMPAPARGAPGAGRPDGVAPIALAAW